MLDREAWLWENEATSQQPDGHPVARDTVRCANPVDEHFFLV